ESQRCRPGSSPASWPPDCNAAPLTTPPGGAAQRLSCPREHVSGVQSAGNLYLSAPAASDWPRVQSRPGEGPRPTSLTGMSLAPALVRNRGNGGVSRRQHECAPFPFGCVAYSRCFVRPILLVVHENA